MQQLLKESPSVIGGGGGSISLIDPVGTTEEVLKTRAEIAKDWIKVLEGVEAGGNSLLTPFFCWSVLFCSVYCYAVEPGRALQGFLL